MTLTDEQVIEDHVDLEMLKRPHLWPGGGKTINLKRGSEEFALCMRARDGSSYRVWPYIGSTFQTADTPIVFADAEGIVDAGWLVD